MYLNIYFQINSGLYQSHCWINGEDEFYHLSGKDFYILKSFMKNILLSKITKCQYEIRITTATIELLSEVMR